MLHKRLLRDLNKVLGFAGQAEVIRNDGPVEHVKDAHQKEEALFTCNPAILNIRLPKKLIGTGNNSIVRQPLRILDFERSLRPQHIHLLAQSVDFLLVDYKPVLAP